MTGQLSGTTTVSHQPQVPTDCSPHHEAPQVVNACISRWIDRCESRREGEDGAAEGDSSTSQRGIAGGEQGKSRDMREIAHDGAAERVRVAAPMVAEALEGLETGARNVMSEEMPALAMGDSWVSGGVTVTRVDGSPRNVFEKLDYLRWRLTGVHM